MSQKAWVGIAGGAVVVLLAAVYSLSGRQGTPPPVPPSGETSLPKVLDATKKAPPSQAVVPGAGKVAIEPAFPVSTSTIKARFEPAPGLGPVSPRYQWYRQGRPIEGATDDSLLPEHFRRDNHIFVRATVEGPAGASVLESRPAIILNSPPTIREVEPNIPVQPDGRFRFQVKGSDPDGETLTYGLESSIPGVKIDPQSGWVEGKVPPGRPTFKLTVSARDPDGLTVRREIDFRLPASFQPEPGQAPKPGGSSGG